MDEIVCIYKTYKSQTADMIKSSLESAGIECYLRSDNAGGTLPYLTQITGIGIMIRKEDEEAANEILRGVGINYDVEFEERGEISDPCAGEYTEDKPDLVSISCLFLIIFIPILSLLWMFGTLGF